MKQESLVIVDQNATVNTFPNLVLTAHHIMEVGNTRKPIYYGATVGSMTLMKL